MSETLLLVPGPELPVLADPPMSPTRILDGIHSYLHTVYENDRPWRDAGYIHRDGEKDV